MNKILILGVGNLVLKDEGIGVHIIHMLKSLGMPDGVDIADGGMGNFTNTTTLQQYKHLILIDAITDGLPVGTVRRVSPQLTSDTLLSMDIRKSGVGDIIKTISLQQAKPHVELLTISVSHAPQLGMQLSPEVRRVIPQVLQLIFEILDDMQGRKFYR